MSQGTSSAFSTHCRSSPRLPVAFEISPTFVEASKTVRSFCRSVVLPAPTSPVTTVMGARVITPYSRTEKARLWAGDQ
jgi:hypothetical protein